MNEKALRFFEDMANDVNLNSNSVKMAKNSDFSDIDAKFILNYANKNSSVLDLGSGTGLIINKIYDKVGKIVAVEPFKNFTDYIIKAPNIHIINQNFNDFDTDEEFDIISFFGVMFYFDINEAKKIYKKFAKNLKKDNGRLIIKNQFGIKETVTISGYSDELKRNYYAQYRYIKDEEKILQELGLNIQIFDIYPPEFNRWDNTHFYAIVGRI